MSPLQEKHLENSNVTTFLFLRLILLSTIAPVGKVAIVASGVEVTSIAIRRQNKKNIYELDFMLGIPEYI